MYALRELLGDALVILLGPERARQAAVLSAWPDVIGEARAKHARALGIRKHTLVVATDLPALFYELGLRRTELIGLLNQQVPGSAINEIQIVMRPLDGSSDEPPDSSGETGRGR